MEKKIIHDFEHWFKEQLHALKSENKVVIIHYFGHFKEDFIYRLSETIEAEVLAHNFSYTVAKKVFSSITEAINNIIKHGHSSESSVGGIILSIENNTVKALISNITEANRSQQISSSLNELNSSSKTNLDSRFYDLMKRAIISNTSNLGIGLLSIRINSSSNINYDFIPLNDDLVIFKLQFEFENTVLDSTYKENKHSSINS